MCFLSQAGEMEVKNPLFNDETPIATPNRMRSTPITSLACSLSRTPATNSVVANAPSNTQFAR